MSKAVAYQGAPWPYKGGASALRLRRPEPRNSKQQQKQKQEQGPFRSSKQKGGVAPEPPAMEPRGRVSMGFLTIAS